jgi:hypothetical protein
METVYSARRRSIMEIEFTFDYDSYEGLHNEDLVGVFNINKDDGGSFVATLLYLKFNDAKIDRGLAVRMYGVVAIDFAEETLEDQIEMGLIEL